VNRYEPLGPQQVVDLPFGQVELVAGDDAVLGLRESQEIVHSILLP
jgi:hypothetical protein